MASSGGFVVLLLLSLPAVALLASASEPLNPEVQALIAIRQGLVDPRGVLGNWDQDSVDPCSWAVITCSAQNLVIGLGAPSQGLSGTLSGRIANLTHLEQVLLQNNNISGRLLPELGALPRLQTLDLSNNRFSGRVPDTLGRVSTLRYLRLNNNSLSGPFPASLAKIPQLSFMDLSFNNLTGPVPVFPTRTFKGGGGEVQGWRAAADRRRDEPGRLLPRALRRVLLPLAAEAPALGGPLLRPRHPRSGRPRPGGRRRRRRGGGGAAGERAPVRAARAAGGHGRVRGEARPGQGRVRQRVPRPARRRHDGGREAAERPRQRVRGGAVPHGGGDDQPRRAPPPAPPRGLLRRRWGAPPRLPLHAQRQRRVAPPREAGAGLGGAEADRGGGGAGPAVPARAVRPQDHPPGRQGRQRAAGRAPRGRRRRLRARQAAGPRRLARHHRGAGHRGPHRARVPLHRPVVGEDGRLRLRDPAARARHRPARARARQGLRRRPQPQGRRHARLGEEGASGEDAGPAGGPGPGPALRPDRGGGDGARRAPLHAVPAVAPAQDVRGGPDAGGRRPGREVGGHEPAGRRGGAAVPRRARLRPPQRLQRLRLLQRLPRQRQQPQQRRGALHRHGRGDGALGAEVAAAACREVIHSIKVQTRIRVLEKKITGRE
ncbi:translation initiation factor IF-2-like isoform X2 [Panicum virgatum]|uniref:translation initiation factor IF-2-like isoform X2 n=1 Tax=Panicum virgatum TaxID=38727 RepID=UPI0019D69D20|nr:translation initiation factor IF-2-like isoform X2 [Panicum virgatum]